ncbi:MAG TPA: aldo/keto reductase [Aggregatilineales bacterium]|nr:aldo/keto reductase [Aggregatilineales bacterium]
MRYKLLGRSGVRVSELCLGTMTFGDAWGWGATAEESKKQFDLFAEAGGNFVDTSVNYTNGQSETILGDLLKADRDHFVLATKFSLTTNPDDPNGGGNSRKNMRRSVERSLKHLQTGYIDLLYLHVWDHMTPLEEVVEGMHDLVQQGKVNYIAFSDTPAYIVSAANTMADLRGWSRFVGLQLPYALNRRDAERAEIPMAKLFDMAVLPWGILGQGILLGKYSPGSTEQTRRDKSDVQIATQTQAIVDTVAAVAAESGMTKTQVCVNWIRQQSRAEFIPILGARNFTQLQDNLDSLKCTLDDEHIKRLDEVSKIDLGFPRDFTEGGGRQYIYGNTFDLIDNHRGNPVW